MFHSSTSATVPPTLDVTVAGKKVTLHLAAHITYAGANHFTATVRTGEAV